MKAYFKRKRGERGDGKGIASKAPKRNENSEIGRKRGEKERGEREREKKRDCDPTLIQTHTYPHTRTPTPTRVLKENRKEFG